MTAMLTRESLQAYIDECRESRTYTLAPDVLIVPPYLRKWGLYAMGETTTIWSLPGAERVSYPEFGSWIVKKWKTANVGYGGGHKWKRRAGIPVVDYWER